MTNRRFLRLQRPDTPRAVLGGACQAGVEPVEYATASTHCKVTGPLTCKDNTVQVVFDEAYGVFIINKSSCGPHLLPFLLIKSHLGRLELAIMKELTVRHELSDGTSVAL